MAASESGERSPRLTEDLPLDAAGRRWVLRASSDAAFEAGSDRRVAPWVALAGVAISGLLFFVLRGRARARQAAEHAAGELRISGEALRESESRLRRLVDSNIIGVVIRYPGGRALEANDAFLKLIGYTREDFDRGRIDWASLTPPDFRELDGRAIDRMRAEGNHAPIEKEYVRKDGSRVPVLLGRALIDPSTGLYVGFAIDLTGRKRQERELREEVRVSDALRRAAVTVSAELSLDKIVEAIVEAANEATGARFSAFFYNVKQESGESYTLYKVAGASRDAFAKFPMPRNTAIFAPTFSGERTVRYDDVTQAPGYGQNAPHQGMPPGHLPVRSYLAVPVVSRSGEVLGGLFLGHPDAGVFTARHESLVSGLAGQAAVAIDNARLYETLEQRVEARTAELRQHQQRLRELAGELTLVEQRERRRIAEGLHDHLGQVLVAMKMQMSAPAPPVPMLRELLDEAIRATRALTFELSPPILYQMGLGPAIRWLAQQMKSQFGLDISVEASPDAEPQAEDLRVFLFQSVRELLMNVVKHAQSETASVTLAREDDKLRLVVEDRGKGFAHPRSGAGTAGGSGFGLFNLAERWHMLGGSFTVTARAEGGTRVVLVAPLAKSVPDAEGLREDADSARR